jgi:hypothetical protein
VDGAAAPALRHRIFLNFEADAAGIDQDTVVAAVVESQSDRARPR